MIYDKPIKRGVEQTSTEWLNEMAALETEELDALAKQATESLQRRNTSRYANMSVERVLAEHEALGLTGFVCERINGKLVVYAIQDTPDFLKETA